MTEEEMREILSRADAGQKLGMVAIEMVVAFAGQLGKSIDVRSFASAMENSEVVDNLSSEDFEIERRARQRVAHVLRDMASRIERG